MLQHQLSGLSDLVSLWALRQLAKTWCFNFGRFILDFWRLSNVIRKLDEFVSLELWIHQPIHNLYKYALTHWGPVTHICVGNLAAIDNCLSSGRCQAIIWTSAGILLTGNFNRNSYIFIQENAFESAAWQLGFIVQPPKCVKSLSCFCIWTSQTFNNDTIIGCNYLKIKTTSASNVPNHNIRRPRRVMFSFVHTLTCPYRQYMVIFFLRIDRLH